MITSFIAWCIHVFFYWIVPVPILLAVEVILRQVFIKKRDAVGINFELQYRCSQIADTARKIPFIGKSIFALAHLAQMHIIYNLVMKEGKRQWMKTHPQSRKINLKQKSVPPVTKLSESPKKSVPSVASIKTRSKPI